ncbi:MAG: DMT family transporter [Bacteroidales bacterium]|nr:DMT family transporter [Bacteroidales bacterium]
MKALKAIIWGHIAMLAANVIWGLMSPVGKDALNSPDIQPLVLTGIRIIGAACLFWLGSLFLPESVAPKEKIEKKDYIHLAIASMLIIFANQILIIFGMSMTSPVDATVMCSTSPFFTLLLIWMLQGEKPYWVKILGVVIGFAGMMTFLLSGKSDAAMHVTNPLLGNVMIVLSQVFGALYMVKYANLTRKYSPFTLMKWLFTISAVLMVFVAGPGIIHTEWNALSSKVLIEVGYVVLFGTFIGYLLLPVGQQVLNPTVIAMYNYLQPVVAAIFSLIAGLAKISLYTIIGTLLIFAGVYLTNLERAKKAN